MIAILCTALSAAAFYSSIGIGDVWPLAWLAPLPILWLAFGRATTRKVAVAAFVSLAIGSSNFLKADNSGLPIITMIFAIGGPAALFAASVVAGRHVAARVVPLAGVLAFASLWTALGYIVSFGPDGTAANIAYSQTGAPLMIQSASVFGIWGIAFLIAFVPATVALSLRRRKFLPALIGVAAFAANAAFGASALDKPNGPTMPVALIDNDALNDAAFADDGQVALATIDAYDREALWFARDHVQLVVFPEKLAIIEPPWRAQAQVKLAATAKAMNATLVAGFDNRNGPVRTNIAWVFPADGSAPHVYEKRHLVPGLESAFTPGDMPLAFPGRLGIEVCKDMDFNRMLRSDSSAHPAIVAVPAWDFGADGFIHARMAIMRGVENDFAVARTSRGGLLSLSDPQGRATATGTYREVFTKLETDVPVGKNPGDTIYDRIGDVLAWACIIASAGLLAAAYRARRRKT